ncbi:DUF3024 domain-containing protein [Paenibacillus mendelii]|uniref:DUF3024 domain-containing protein n=1 Tax=Paenibacillus mendelii TaxID=206163 RepID=A0ABV6J4P8_9BACL|nr:DUF3024 domain-containing protein [Paenibacillus mendelii]MCQ6560447.1 DUF3024 domain-containing protein [Paenibacillus mendelii]
MLDEFTRLRVTRILQSYIEQKVPKEIRNEIKLKFTIRGNNVTLKEERLGYQSRWFEYDIAQFRFKNETNTWSVYWRDSKDKWHLVEEIAPSGDFVHQLQCVDVNASGIFWH